MRLLVLTLLFVGGAAIPTVDPVLKEVLHAVEKGLEFFSDDYSAINVDGLFGLRLGQGK